MSTIIVDIRTAWQRCHYAYYHVDDHGVGRNIPIGGAQTLRLPYKPRPPLLGPRAAPTGQRIGCPNASYVRVPLGNGVLTPHTLYQEANSPWIRALRGWVQREGKKKCRWRSLYSNLLYMSTGSACLPGPGDVTMWVHSKSRRNFQRLGSESNQTRTATVLSS